MIGAGRTADRGVLLRPVSRHPDPALRLICVPHAGSGPLAHAQWCFPEELGIEVWSVCLPGRENRRAEQPVRRIAPTAEALAAEVEATATDLPFAFFGHSMGALIAFETTRLLQARGTPSLEHLFLSGFRAPDLPPWRPAVATLEDDAFLHRLDEIAGPSQSVVRDRELLLFFSDVIRADFEACESYQYRAGPPLDVPVTCLTAVDDVEVRVDEVAGWWRHFSGECPVRLFDGGHLYLLDHRDVVLALVARELAGVRSRR